MIICFPQCNRSQESCGQLHKYCSIHGNKIPNFHPRFSADLHRVLVFHRPVKTTAGWKLSTEYTRNKTKVTERYHSHRKFKCFFKNCSQFCFLKLVAYSHQNQLSLVSATDIFKSNDVLSSTTSSNYLVCTHQRPFHTFVGSCSTHKQPGTTHMSEKLVKVMVETKKNRDKRFTEVSIFHLNCCWCFFSTKTPPSIFHVFHYTQCFHTFSGVRT